MWFTLIVSSLFVLASFMMAIKTPEALPSALAGGSFFGLCAAVALNDIVKKRRRRLILDGLQSVEVNGQTTLGVTFWRTDILGASLLIVGLLGVWGGGQINPLFPWLSVLIALSGLAAIVFARTNSALPLSLQFEPQGLRVRHRDSQYRIDWDGMAVSGWNVSGQDFLVIDTPFVDRVIASVSFDREQTNARQTKKLLERFQRSQANFGGILMINPPRFGTDAVYLSQAIQHCIDKPEARSRLVPLVDGA
ncbi:MAG: hypothetical protein AAF004_11140 [Pseudomonadota bacterium]